MRVLLIEPYPVLAKALKRGLEEEGFTVEVAWGDPNQLPCLPPTDFGAIILDLGRPRESSLSLLQGWRRVGLTTYVLVLTTPGDNEDAACGLDAWADEWLTKPFELEELLVRLRSVARGRSPVKDALLPSAPADWSTRMATSSSQQYSGPG
jgi:DNA-binding response OmpR family regulator